MYVETPIYVPLTRFSLDKWMHRVLDTNPLKIPCSYVILHIFVEFIVIHDI